MKKWIACFAVVLLSCKQNSKADVDSAALSADTIRVEKKAIEDQPEQKEYANARFRHVTIEEISENQFRIKGEGQIFEASFSWVIEDGHNELKKGFEMTDAGAPEWGKFDFTVEIEKPENTTLTLLLFEISAKDGSRQHELPIPLP
jgi:hypothetical protein